jgi:hypothetical protein
VLSWPFDRNRRVIESGFLLRRSFQYEALATAVQLGKKLL